MVTTRSNEDLMKFEDLALIGVAGYLLYNSLKGSAAPALTESTAAGAVAALPPSIIPSLGGAQSTAVGVVPSALSFPYNVTPIKITAVAPSGAVYGEYTKNGLGYSGVIPQVAPAAAPATTPLLKSLTTNVISSVAAPVGGYQTAAASQPKYLVQSWVGSISDKSVSSFYVQDTQTGTVTRGYSTGMVTKMYNEGILTVPSVIKTYLGLK